MNFITKYFKNNTLDLQIEIKSLEKDIQYLKELHSKDLAIKDLEINTLKERLNFYSNSTIDKLKKSPPMSSKTSQKEKLSYNEEHILRLHHNHQCKNYEDLQKVSNKSKVNLRNLVSKIKKKGYEFNWHF